MATPQIKLKINDSATETINVNTYVVQHYDMQLVRSRRENGYPYGPIMQQEADFVIRVSSANACRPFYERLNQAQTFDYTIQLSSINQNEAASPIFSMTGYIIGIDECYEYQKNQTEEKLDALIRFLKNQENNSFITARGLSDYLSKYEATDEQVMIKVHFLLTKVSYPTATDWNKYNLLA